MKGEKGFHAGKDISETGSGDTGDQQREKRSHGQIDHQHLKGEDEPGDGGLEDAGDGACSSTADKQHHRLMVHTEETTEVTADGRTGEDDGGLGSDGTSEADGDGTGKDGTPTVVGFQPALTTADGIE